MWLRKSSRRRKGSKSDGVPKPNARRRWTPAPSRVGLDRTRRLTGRMDMVTSGGSLGGAGRFGLQELDPVAERVAELEPLAAGQGHRLHHLHTGFRQPR